MDSLQQFIQSTSPYNAWATNNTQGLRNHPHIEHSITIGRCALISDGSFCPLRSQASGAWFLGNDALHRLICGYAPCTGMKATHSAYRGELAGLYNGLLFLHHLCTFRNIQNGRILIGYDGQGAINKIQKSHVPLSTNHFDYLSSIRNLLEEIPITCDFIHVKGHLDKKLEVHQLSIVERLNVFADSLAKQANTPDFDEDHTANLSLYKEYGPLTIKVDHRPTKITSSLSDVLYSYLTQSPSRQYWLRKLHIPPALNPSMAWNEIAQAFNSLPTSKQIETIKWNADFCETASNLYRWNEQSHSNCPTCGAPNENTHHILTCPHPASQQQWNQSVDKLKDWLTHQQTSPDMTHVIIENLKSWHDNRW